MYCIGKVSLGYRLSGDVVIDGPSYGIETIPEAQFFALQKDLRFF